MEGSSSSRSDLDRIVLSTLSQSEHAPHHAAPGDQGDSDDGDSALGDDSASETRSLTQSIMDYEYENGRRYHAYQAGKYPMPNDEQEQARMDFQHHLYLMIFGGELYRAPLPPRINRALDVGCGTGKWAFDFADSRTQTDVTGETTSHPRMAFSTPLT